jgi:hypothetical protein
MLSFLVGSTSPATKVARGLKCEGLSFSHVFLPFLSPLGQAGNASLVTGKPVVVRFPDLLYKCKKARYRRR